MKLKSMLTGCCVLLLAACVAEPNLSSSSIESSMDNTPASSSASSSTAAPNLDGKSLYEATCAGVCHSLEGVGSLFPLNNELLSSAEMIAVIRDEMPDGNALACGQLCAEAVTDYIKNTLFNKPASSQSSSSQNNQSASSDSPAMGTLLERGATLYFRDTAAGSCASCHGNDGEGIANKGGALVAREGDAFESCDSCGSIGGLTQYIDTKMPNGGAHLCQGQCAEDIAAYIMEAFNDGYQAANCNDPIQKASPMRRLNKVEIANAVNDVFGAGAVELAAALPDETEVIGGFATVGSALSTSEDWTQALLEGALSAADIIVNTGKFPACGDAIALVEPQPALGECTTTGQCRTLYTNATDCNNAAGGVCYCGTQVCGTSAPTPNQCFETATRSVAQLMFRRQLNNAEFMRFDNLRREVSNKTGNDADGYKAVVASMISSPRFMFALAADDKTQARNLTPAELADRLAMALWGSIPDATLLAAANNNGLQGEQLDQQIDRMMLDAKFDRFAQVFVDAWIGFGGYKQEGSDLAISNQAWQQLLADMQTETRLFIAHIIQNNLPINEIYTANYSFLNARLQKHYGLTETTSNTHFVKTNFPANSSRRGLMTHASVLAKAFDGSKTSVVVRGVLPLEAFTCTAPEPPLNNPAVENAVNEQANSNLTEKEKVLDRANRDACKTCHAEIDPIGWAFTEFGLAGQSVSLDPDGDPLNVHGELYGQDFNNAGEMIGVMAAKAHFAPCFATKFLIHTIGRKVQPTRSTEDQCAIETAVEKATNDGSVGAKDLLKAILTSKTSTYTGTIQ